MGYIYIYSVLYVIVLFVFLNGNHIIGPEQW